MVPAYTLPSNLEDMVVMRVVCRNGFTRDMANMLVNDIKSAVAEFEKLEYPTQARVQMEKSVKVEQKFNHTGKYWLRSIKSAKPLSKRC